MAFLVFEGLDGSGKSTLIKNLNTFLINKNLKTMVTREPGGTPLGEELREILLKNQDQPPCPKAELLIYEAVRAQHVELKIRPELKNKVWVLCDRFTGSSIAFQSGGREISINETKWLNQFATSNLQADMTVLLDISYNDSQKRMKNADRGERDRIENEDKSFHERVRESYLEQAAIDKSWVVLDANLSEQELFEAVVNKLESKGFLS